MQINGHMKQHLGDVELAGDDGVQAEAEREAKVGGLYGDGADGMLCPLENRTQ